MVNTLISYILILKKLSKGEVLSKHDLRIVKSYLGLSFTNLEIMGLIFSFILLVVGVIFHFLNIYLYLEVIFYIMAILTVIYIIPIPAIYEKLYLKKLNIFLEVVLSSYKDMHFKVVNFNNHTKFNINKKIVYFIYDDFYFYIKEDVLVREEIKKFKKSYILKYPDLNSVNKEPIFFKLSDILSFEGKDDGAFSSSGFLDIINYDEEKPATFKLNLNNLKTLELSNDIYPYFKNLISEREA